MTDGGHFPGKGCSTESRGVDFQYDIAKILRNPKMYIKLATYLPKILKYTN